MALAFWIKRLSSIASLSTSSLARVLQKEKKHYAFSIRRSSISTSATCFKRHFCEGQTFRKQPNDLHKSDDGKTVEEFSKWSNGSGTFHAAACIHPTAVIEVGAVVHAQALVGPNVYIGSGTIVGPSVTVGRSTSLGCNVSLSNCEVGDFCIIHHGVCIGQDGFGFLTDKAGNVMKKPQNMKAKLGNHVEIGANTCIDRGSWRDTTIGDHTKIDNLVQIGHNVVVGKSCIICGQVGIAGSAVIGDYVTLGGRVAIRDHISIVPKVRLAANSCVTKNITEPGDYGGFPAMPIGQWRRQVAKLRKDLE